MANWLAFTIADQASFSIPVLGDIRADNSFDNNNYESGVSTLLSSVGGNQAGLGEAISRHLGLIGGSVSLGSRGGVSRGGTGLRQGGERSGQINVGGRSVENTTKRRETRRSGSGGPSDRGGGDIYQPNKRGTDEGSSGGGGGSKEQEGKRGGGGIYIPPGAE